MRAKPIGHHSAIGAPGLPNFACHSLTAMQSTIAQKALVGQAVVAKATTRPSVRAPVVVRAQKEEAVRPSSV